jgi:hypothetical protein
MVIRVGSLFLAKVESWEKFTSPDTSDAVLLADLGELGTWTEEAERMTGRWLCCSALVFGRKSLHRKVSEVKVALHGNVKNTVNARISHRNPVRQLPTLA